METRQTTLRTWMAIILAWSLLLAWVRSLGSIDSALIVATNSYIAWALSFIVALACARRFGPIVRGSWGRATGFVLVALIVAVGLYLAWAHRRAFHIVDLLQEGPPYPDPALNALDLWFEVRHPVPRGFLKLHGEWNRVALVLGTTVLVLAGVSGLLAGALSNQSKERTMPIARLVALIFALTALILLTPAVVMIAIAVRMSSPGPILIRKQRRRNDNTTYPIDLFRTNNVRTGQPTKLGQFLRSHSLDQLPALFTLLSGEMTLGDCWDHLREPPT